jgi:hypothetical protein
MHLTFSDEKIVNVMYKCARKCKDDAEGESQGQADEKQYY